MGNAKYTGHVGALAAAVGIGTAVATTPWVAAAEPSADPAPAAEHLVERTVRYEVHIGRRRETYDVLRQFGSRSYGIPSPPKIGDRAQFRWRPYVERVGRR